MGWIRGVKGRLKATSALACARLPFPSLLRLPSRPSPAHVLRHIQRASPPAPAPPSPLTAPLPQHKHLQPTGAGPQGPNSFAALNQAFNQIRDEFTAIQEQCDHLRGQRDEYESKRVPFSRVRSFLSLIFLPRPPNIQSLPRSPNSTSSANPSTTSRLSMARSASSTRKKSVFSVPNSTKPSVVELQSPLVSRP